MVGTMVRPHMTRAQRRAILLRRRNNRWKTAVGSAVVGCMLMGPTAFASDKKAQANTAARMRSEPTTDSKIVTVVYPGEKVTILDDKGEWSYVTFGDTKGYILTKLLTETKSSSSDDKKSGGSSDAKSGDAKSGSSDGGKSSAYDAVDINKLRAEAPMMQRTLLKVGTDGDKVRWFQEALMLADCFLGPASGTFDANTEEAVKRFQNAHSLLVDGEVGKDTIAAFFNVLDVDASSFPTSTASAPTTNVPTAKIDYTVPTDTSATAAAQQTPAMPTSSSAVTVPGFAQPVELLEWFAEGKTAFTKNTPARVYDVKSGKSYYVTCFSAGNHADVVPVTREDTQVLYETYNFQWSWTPRPVVVTVDNRTFVGSINGMPHGTTPNLENGMDGQICIHLLGSKTHNGNKDFEQDHQSALLESWVWAQSQRAPY